MWRESGRNLTFFGIDGRAMFLILLVLYRPRLWTLGVAVLGMVNPFTLLAAAFPQELPEWFIKLFTKENDVVLDPFMGSGTTITVAQRMWRKSIGIEIIPEYYDMVKAKFNNLEPSLF